VDALDAQIDLLKATMDQLIADRDDLAERVRLYPAVLAPVRRIPQELICEIFSWTLPCTRKIGEWTVDQPPWYLGHVCSTWRAIAGAYPSLWSPITVFHDKFYHHEDTTPLAMLETQLLRSRNALLTVYFRWWMDGALDAAPILTVLPPHSNRWRSFEFQCIIDSSRTLLPLLHHGKGQLAQLKRYLLHCAWLA